MSPVRRSSGDRIIFWDNLDNSVLPKAPPKLIIKRAEHCIVGKNYKVYNAEPFKPTTDMKKAYSHVFKLF